MTVCSMKIEGVDRVQPLQNRVIDDIGRKSFHELLDNPFVFQKKKKKMM